jgi:hypothetical protein
VIEPRFFVYEHRRVDTGEVFYIGKGTWTPLKKYIRASTTSKRNIHWKRIVAKAGGFTHHILSEFVSESDALAEEIRQIEVHGRSNFGGILSNITAGGEGQSGVVMSDSTKRKISDANKGRPKPKHVRLAVSAAQIGVPNPPEQNKAHSMRMRGAGHPQFGKKQSAETIAKRVATRGDKCSGENHPFFGKTRPEHVKKALSDANSKPVWNVFTGTVYHSVDDAAYAVGKSITTVCRWLNGKRNNPTDLRYA